MFTLAFVLLLSGGWSPRQVVVVGQAVLAVVAHRVVRAVALPVNHAHDVLKEDLSVTIKEIKQDLKMADISKHTECVKDSD